MALSRSAADSKTGPPATPSAPNRVLDDVRTERRTLDQGNSGRTFNFPGLEEVRERISPMSARSGLCVSVNDAALFAVDVGEWGGGVDVVDRRGRRKVFDGNVKRLVRTSAGLVAVGGLAHMLSDWGYLGELAIDARGPRVVSLACLPSNPENVAVDDDGTLVLVLTVYPWAPNCTSTPRAPREMTIALDDDGSLYDIACHTGNPGERLPISWDTSQDADGCMKLASGPKTAGH